jgi:ureidoglycolate lyase
MKKKKLTLRPLTDAAFAPFGEVIQKQGHHATEINDGITRKYANLAQIEVDQKETNPAIHIYRSRPISLPFRIEGMEKHPSWSQTFMPLHNRPFPIVVAPPSEQLDIDSIRGFFTNGEQGINLHKGVWHHYQLTLEQSSDYLVIDAGRPGDDTVFCRLDLPLFIEGFL